MHLPIYIALDSELDLNCTLSERVTRSALNLSPEVLSIYRSALNQLLGGTHSIEAAHSIKQVYHSSGADPDGVYVHHYVVVDDIVRSVSIVRPGLSSLHAFKLGAPRQEWNMTDGWSSAVQHLVLLVDDDLVDDLKGTLG